MTASVTSDIKDWCDWVTVTRESLTETESERPGKTREEFSAPSVTDLAFGDSVNGRVNSGDLLHNCSS